MRNALKVLASAALLVVGPGARAGTTDTPKIIADTFAALPACFNWRPIGVCIWLSGCPFNCRIRTSIKVAHNMADLVVPVYNDLDEHPITDIGPAFAEGSAGALRGIVSVMSGGTQDQIGSQGGRTEDAALSVGDEVWDRRTLIFREADAIGNPTSVVLGIAAGAVDAGLAGSLSGALSLPDLDTLAEAFQGIDFESLTQFFDGLDLDALGQLRGLLDGIDFTTLTELPEGLANLPDQLSQFDVSRLANLSDIVQGIDLGRITAATGLDLSGLDALSGLPGLVQDFNATQALTDLGAISDSLQGVSALENLSRVTSLARGLAFLGDFANLLSTFGDAEGLPDAGDFDLSGFTLPDLSGIDFAGLTGESDLDLSEITGGTAPAPGVSDLICPAAATIPLFPHFQSGLDAMVWRDFVPAEAAAYPIASVTPGVREIGDWPFNTWGSVHPRIGFIATQPVEPKAAAVIAQRAGDIVTRAGQPHIYVATEQGIVTRAGYRVWMPPPLVEADEETGTWQMLVPLEERECEVFGQNDVFALPGTAWADGKLDFSDLPFSEDDQDTHGGDYVWNLWRPYQCCRVRGQFITDIDF